MAVFTVKHNTENICFRFFGINYAYIHSELRTAYVAPRLISERFNALRYLAYKAVIRFCKHIRASCDYIRTSRCKLKEALKPRNTLRTCSRKVSLLRTQNGINYHFLPCPWDCNIKSSPSAVTVKRAEVHRNLSVLVRTVAHREQYNVTLVTLYIFKVLDKHRLVTLCVKISYIRVLRKCVNQHIVDKILLNRAERYYAYAVIPQLFIAQPADDFIDYSLRFSLVLLCLALVIEAFRTDKPYLRYKVIRWRERIQLIVIILHIAVCDKALVPWAVVPLEIHLRHRDCKAVVKQALQILKFAVVLVNTVACKEWRRRQLLRIAYYNDILAPCYSTDSLACRKLWRFIKYHKVEFREWRIDILCHWDRAHKHTRTEPSEQCRYLIEQLSERHHSAVVFDSLLQYSHLGGCGARTVWYGYICRQPCRKLLHSEPLIFLYRSSVFVNQSIILLSIEWGKPLVCGDSHKCQLIIKLAVISRSYIICRYSAVFIGKAHSRKPCVTKPLIRQVERRLALYKRNIVRNCLKYRVNACKPIGASFKFRVHRIKFSQSVGFFRIASYRLKIFRTSGNFLRWTFYEHIHNVLFFAVAESVWSRRPINSLCLMHRPWKHIPVGRHTGQYSARYIQRRDYLPDLLRFFRQFNQPVIQRAYIALFKCGRIFTVDFKFLIQPVLTYQLR